MSDHGTKNILEKGQQSIFHLEAARTLNKIGSRIWFIIPGHLQDYV